LVPALKQAMDDEIVLSILFYMVICRMRYIWSNLPGMLLRRRIKSDISRRQYMDSSRIHEHGLKSLASPSLALIFIGIIQITLSLFGILSLD